MKKLQPVHLLLILLTLFVSSTVLAQESVTDIPCRFGEIIVPLGETVSTVDEVLVQQYRQGMKQTGNYSDEEIEKELKSNEWVAIHLICVRSYISNTDFNQEKALVDNERAAFISVGPSVLVPLDHQIRWIETMKGLTVTYK